MESATLQAELQMLRRQKPFVPFRIVKTDKQRINVTERLSFGCNDIMAFGVKASGGSWQVRFGEIEAVEVMPLNTPDSLSELLQRITVNPAQCGGGPCIRGMRIRVADVLDLLVAGQTYGQVLADMPDLDEDDIRACLAYAAEQSRK